MHDRDQTAIPTPYAHLSQKVIRYLWKSTKSTSISIRTPTANLAWGMCLGVTKACGELLDYMTERCYFGKQTAQC